MSSRKNERNGSTVATTTYEYQFPQPKEKISFGQYIYNPKEGTFFGRDASSWSKLLLFYAIFYAVLAGLFAICMQGLFAALNDEEPRWQLESSIIGTNPGLGYRPLARETERGAIIDFSTSNNDSKKLWIDLLDSFLEPYYNKTALKYGGLKQKHCDFKTKLKADEVCSVNLSNIGDCSKDMSYGYFMQKPCVFLKLNKIFGWEPEYYDAEGELPDDMPADLKNHIASLPKEERKQVWVSCKALHSHHVDLIQEFKFPLFRGFPAYYYPYKNTKDYLSPLVPVQITFKESGINTLVGIECRAWAKNIIYSPSIRDRQGSVTFQFNIDYNK